VRDIFPTDCKMLGKLAMWDTSTLYKILGKIKRG